jgi:Methyltransferase domain
LTVEENLQILEVGSFEGRSSLWFANHALIGPNARLDCVDTWEGSVEHNFDSQTLLNRFRQNLLPFLGVNVFAYVGKSAIVLPRIYVERGPNAYDIAYLDGSHFAKDCLFDAAMAYEMIKVGGYIIFDDYGWDRFPQEHYCPKIAIDSFIRNYTERIKVIHVGYQVIVQKLDDS